MVKPHYIEKHPILPVKSRRAPPRQQAPSWR